MLTALLSWSGPSVKILGTGTQPQITADAKGMIRVVFGREDKIYCATSSTGISGFSNPVLVGQVKGMHLGMSRGPQLASSKNYSVVTAIDKAGNIHWFKLSHTTGKWKYMGPLNDLKGSAPEGLMSIAADSKDNFYAVWLDIRTAKSNQIYFSSLSGGTGQWSKNRLVYQSPDQHVCECCKPNITVQGANVYIMFRNWLNGSRDLYLAKSSEAGKSFSKAEKLGRDTWKLNGCPMDGGGITVDQSNNVQTTWQRKGVVYYCQPGEPEIYIGPGRNSTITGTGNTSTITYQNNDTVKVVTLKDKKVHTLGNGGFAKTVALSTNRFDYVWENDNKIYFSEL